MEQLTRDAPKRPAATFFTETFKHVIYHALAGGILAGVAFVTPSLRTLTVPLYVPVIVGVASALVASFFYRRRKQPGVITNSYGVIRGRDEVMEVNLQLMVDRSQKAKEARSILSTRVTQWAQADTSKHRTVFRATLDDAIEHGVLVKRVWNICSPDDARRLLEIMEKHKGKAGHSISVYFDVPHSVMPEILVIDKEVASVSLPQNSNPRTVAAATIMTDKPSIELVEQYFDTLFEQGLVAFKNGQPQAVVVKRLEKKAAAKR